MYKILFIIFTLSILSRSTFAGSISLKPADKYEKVVIITDRSLYVTSEKIQFFAFFSVGKDVTIPVLSQVLYCELISPNGGKIADSKCIIRNSTATGCIEIPRDLLTGTYYLRGYTKNMRNYGPEFYGYSQIRIINPEKDEILAADNIRNSEILPYMSGTATDIKDLLSVYVDKTSYSPREIITLSVQTANPEESVIHNVSLSVVPENTVSLPGIISTSKKPAMDKTEYYAETRGLSVSGKLTVAGSEKPVSDKKVNLSIIGEGRDFMSARTDNLGRFFFAMPEYTGSRDLFICAEKIDSLKVKIWVDNDFCTLPFQLPSPAFKLLETERQTLKNMAQNAQINSLFYKDSLSEKQSSKQDNSKFYGKPTAIIYIDKYIQLPTLEDYFNELPSEVKVRKRKGESRFAVLGSRGVSFYDPLVMIDWVAIDEPARILAVSPQNISRIEVVNEDYVKGGETYGGIISIISKKGDFAGIDLPSAGVFINYQFLPENNCNTVIYDNVASHPDSRNTILWKPGISLPNGKPEKFEFTAPDTPGKYNIVIEGITTKGEVFTTTSVFEVKN